MSQSPLFIPVLLGTPRQNRGSEKVARWVHRKIRERGEMDSLCFDVRDFDLPRDHYGTEIGFPSGAMRSSVPMDSSSSRPNTITAIREL